jgi:hypothetical protein
MRKAIEDARRRCLLPPKAFRRKADQGSLDKAKSQIVFDSQENQFVAAIRWFFRWRDANAARQYPGAIYPLGCIFPHFWIGL